MQYYARLLCRKFRTLQCSRLVSPGTSDYVTLGEKNRVLESGVRDINTKY